MIERRAWRDYPDALDLHWVGSLGSASQRLFYLSSWLPPAVEPVLVEILSRRLKKWTPQPCWPPDIRKIYVRFTQWYTQAVRVAYGCGIYECQIDPPRIISSDNQDMHTCPAIQLNSADLSKLPTGHASYFSCVLRTATGTHAQIASGDLRLDTRL
jgi:hypothetical protein